MTDLLRARGNKADGVRVRAAGRLSFTLIDMNGSTGRRNGMASLALRDRGLELTLEPIDGVTHELPGTAHAAPIGELLDVLRDRWGGPAVRCAVDTALPAHSGFGSKTATLLAAGRGYAAVCGQSVESGELARICGRGGTSGAGVNLIDTGGFLVDGGHANPPGFAEDPHRYLVPSRFAGAAARTPPPLVRLPFPPWPILVILPEGVELQGKDELDWFRRTMPIPFEEACRTAHLVLMNLAPAVAEADYPAFCRAVNRLTFETHFKQAQIAIQSPAVRNLLTGGREDPDIDAIGMSVSGPMCFAFSRRPDEVVRRLERDRADGRIRDFWFTTAQNHGAVVEDLAAGAGVR